MVTRRHHLLGIRRMGLPHPCPQMPVPSQMRVPSVARRFCVLFPFPVPFSTSFPWQMVPQAGPDAGAAGEGVLSSHLSGPARDSYPGAVIYLGFLPLLYAWEGTCTSSSPTWAPGSAAEPSASAGALGRVTPYSALQAAGQSTWGLFCPAPLGEEESDPASVKCCM